MGCQLGPPAQPFPHLVLDMGVEIRPPSSRHSLPEALVQVGGVEGMQVTRHSQPPTMHADIHAPSTKLKAQGSLGPLTGANAKAEDEGKDAGHGQVGHPGDGAL